MPHPIQKRAALGFMPLAILIVLGAILGYGWVIFPSLTGP